MKHKLLITVLISFILSIGLYANYHMKSDGIVITYSETYSEEDLKSKLYDNEIKRDEVNNYKVIQEMQTIIINEMMEGENKHMRYKYFVENSKKSKK